jgi:hypothetical protein
LSGRVKHKKVVDLVEGVETRAEKAFLEKVKRELEDTWNYLRAHQGYVGTMPEVTSAVARRI